MSSKVGIIEVKIELPVGCRTEFRYIQVIDSAFRTIHGFWSDKLEYSFSGIRFGCYEVRVSDTVGNRALYLVDISDGSPIAEVIHHVKGGAPEVELDSNGKIVDMEKWRHLIFTPFDTKMGWIGIVVWSLVDQQWVKRSTNSLAVSSIDPVKYVFRLDGMGATGLEFLSPNEERLGKNRFLVIPPGKIDVCIEFTVDWLHGGEFFTARVILGDPAINGLVDFMHTGQVDQGRQLFKRDDFWSYVTTFERDSLGSMVVASFLMKESDYGLRNTIVEEMIESELLFSDGNILYAWDCLGKGSAVFKRDFWPYLWLAVEKGVPYLAQNLHMLYEGLCLLVDVGHDHNGRSLVAKKIVGEWKRHVVKSQPFTTFKNYRPIEYTNNWEAVGGLDEFDEVHFPVRAY